MYHDCVTELAQMLEGRAAVCPSARASRAYLMREGRVLFVQEASAQSPQRGGTNAYMGTPKR